MKFKTMYTAFLFLFLLAGWSETAFCADTGGVSNATQRWSGKKIFVTDTLVSETLTGAKTLVVTDSTFQHLDPGGSSRNVTLPAEEGNGGLWYYIINAADAAENLVIKDDGGSTIATIQQSQAGIVACSGSAWKGFAMAATASGTLQADGSVAGATGQAQDFGTNGIKADVIAESTGAAGVTIDSVVLKDGGAVFSDGATIEVDTVNEATAAAGVTADGVLMKDGNVYIKDGGADNTLQITTATDEGGNYTVTIPDLAGNDVIAMIGVAQTFSGACTFSAGIVPSAITGQDSSLGITGIAGAGGGAGGAVPIAGGAGNDTGNGGAVSLTGGASGAGATGNGGASSVVGGAAASTNGAGGAVAATGGAGAGTGAGGAVAVTGGASGAGATGNGGAVSATGGAATSTNGNGGAASLIGGVATGTGTGGAITITSGASAGAGGTAGAVAIDAGSAAGGTAGAITIGATNAASIGIGSASITTTITGALNVPNTGLQLLDTGGDHYTNIKQNSDEAASRTLNIPALGGDDTIMTLGVPGTVTGNITLSGNVVRASQKYTYAANIGHVGGTAGFVTNAGADTNLVTCPQSQTASTFVVPVPFFKPGSTITAFGLIGQIESGGNAVTVDADLRVHTAAAGDVTDASVSTITQISKNADYAITASDDKTGLSQVTDTDESYYVLITVTTNAACDVALQAITVTFTEN